MIITDFEQGSESWLESRIGVLTGTRIKKIITEKKLGLSSVHKDMIYRLIDENITGLSSEKQISTPEIERGNILEPLARKAYEKETGNKISETGLCLSEKNKLHGVSPDGWADEMKGAIEIKCHGVPHVKCIVENSIPSEHRLQINNYFLVNESLEWLDFVSYRPEFFHQPIFIKRVSRVDIQSDLDKMQEMIDAFFKDYESILTSIIF